MTRFSFNPRSSALAACLLAGSALSAFAGGTVVPFHTVQANPAATSPAGQTAQDHSVPPTQKASDYPGKPAPILLSPFASAVAQAPAAPGAPVLGPLAPPDLETESQRSLRVTVETFAAVAGIFADRDCAFTKPVRFTGCPDRPPETYR